MTLRCINRYVIDERDYIIGRVESRTFEPSAHDLYLPLIDGGVLIPDDIRDALLDGEPITIVPYRTCMPTLVITKAGL